MPVVEVVAHIMVVRLETEVLAVAVLVQLLEALLEVLVLILPETAQIIGAVAVVALRLVQVLLAQAALVWSSLNTLPNLIIKSSKHQVHGLHPLELLRSST